MLKVHKKVKVNDLILINKKIEELKDKYRRVRFGQIGEIYKILNELVKLKKATNSRYTERSLEWEKDLNLTDSDIRVIFAYPYISDYGEKMVREGKIFDYIICKAIRTNTLFREVQWQNKYIKGLISKEFKSSELFELKKENIKRVLTGKEVINDYDSYFKSVLKSIRDTRNRLSIRKKELKSSVFKDELIKEVENLNKFIQEIK